MKFFKKYFFIIKTTWQKNLEYRATIFAYRIGEVVEVIFVTIMWIAIYGNRTSIGGYTLNEMITYILVGTLFRLITTNYVARVIMIDIKNGRLSIYLLKPIEYFRNMMAEAIGRMSLSVMMSFIFLSLVILVFFNKIIFNFDPLYLFVILTMIIFSFVMELLLAFLIGLIGFWTDETDGLRYTIKNLKDIIAGSVFPLNLLPAVFVNISLFFPFAYSFFVPMQLYLKKINPRAGWQGILVQLVWIILLYVIIKLVWRQGLKKYEGVGI